MQRTKLKTSNFGGGDFPCNSSEVVIVVIYTFGYSGASEEVKACVVCRERSWKRRILVEGIFLIMVVTYSFESSGTYPPHINLNYVINVAMLRLSIYTL